MRYIARPLTSLCFTEEINSLCTMRAPIEQRLLSLAQYNDKSSSEMSILDFLPEQFRLSALIYVNYALQPFLPCTTTNTSLYNLKSQLIGRLEDCEELTGDTSECHGSRPCA